MKILHTSDWHIGKQLHKIDLSADINLFLDWLITLISEEHIDVLLISGDVFDQANPSQSSLALYYGFLKRMIGKDCEIVITGGNHDSASVLNAPKDILSFLDINVIGGAPEDFKDLFFQFSKGSEKVVVAAVPFLKDKDIRKSAAGETYSDKIEQIKEGIKGYFKSVNNEYTASYSGIPFIVMGHLFVQGAHVSDSMRDIQIGNQAGVDGSIFGEEPHYVALGHIHKPYAVSRSKNIHYSGSPISLSFSEKEDVKQINIIDVTNGDLEVEIAKVPKFRNLIAFEGTLESIREELGNYSQTTPLVSLAEIIVNEPNENVLTRQELDALLENHNNTDLQIIKSRLNFTNKIRGASDAFQTGISVADVTPMEMFEKKLELDGEHDNAEELKNAFRQILEDLNL